MISFMFALLLIASISMGEALQASRPGRISGEWVTPLKRHQRASLALKGWSWGDEGNARELRRLDEARELRQEARDEARELRRLDEARELRRLDEARDEARELRQEAREQRRLEFLSNSLIMMANVSETREQRRLEFLSHSFIMMANASRENSMVMANVSRENSMMMTNASIENSKAMNRSSRNTSISIAVGYVVLIAICLVINRKDPAVLKIMTDTKDITAYLNKNKVIISICAGLYLASIVGGRAVKLITFISGLFK
jgi:hypothetical protein